MDPELARMAIRQSALPEVYSLLAYIEGYALVIGSLGVRLVPTVVARQAVKAVIDGRLPWQPSARTFSAHLRVVAREEMADRLGIEARSRALMPGDDAIGSMRLAVAQVGDLTGVEAFAHSAAELMPYVRIGDRALKRQTFEHDILPFFGSLRLDEVTFPKVEAWRVALINQGKAPSTVRRIMIEFRSLLGYARKSKLLAELPEWPKQKVPKPAPKFLTFEESDRLIAAAAPLDPWRAMVIVGVRTGLRYGELAALRWQDIDFDGYKLTVEENFVNGVTGPPKSGHGRTVPLSRDAHAALVAIRHNRGPLVFCGPRGTHVHHSTAVLAIKAIAERAGLVGVHWHRLRHTFASHLVIRGVGLRTVMEFMGHSKFELTLRYAHLAPELRRDAVMLLDGPPPAPRVWPKGDTDKEGDDDGDDDDDDDDDDGN